MASNVLDSFIAHNCVGADETLKVVGKSHKDNKGSDKRTMTKKSESKSVKSSIHKDKGYNSKSKMPTGQSTKTAAATGTLPSHSGELLPTGQLETTACMSTGHEFIDTNTSTGRSSGTDERLPTGCENANPTDKGQGPEQVDDTTSSSGRNAGNVTDDSGFAMLNKQMADFMMAMTQQTALVTQTMGKLTEMMSDPGPEYYENDDDHMEENETSHHSDNDIQVDVNDEARQDANEVADDTTGEDTNMNAVDVKMKAIREEYEKEIEGPPVSSKMAGLITDMLQGMLKVEQINKKIEAVKRPSNIPYLKAPLVNERVWKLNAIRSETKTADLKFQTVQRMLIAGLVPIIKVVDTMCEAKNGLNKETVDKLAVELLEGLQMLTQTNHTINNKRKDLFREDLPKRLEPMCNHTEKVTTELFGDEIEKTMDTLDKVKRYDYEGKAFRGKAPRHNFLGGRGGYRHPHSYFNRRYRQQNQQNRQGQNSQWQRNYAPQEHTRQYGQQRAGYEQQRGGYRGRFQKRRGSSRSQQQ